MKPSDKLHILKMGFILTQLLFVLTAFKAWSKHESKSDKLPISTEILSDKKIEIFK
jgi:hypothetical protein